MEYNFIGYDPNNIPRVWGIDNTKQMAKFQRVWGIDNTKQMAKFQAHTEALHYIKRRPDTMPISEWTFLENEKQND